MMGNWQVLPEHSQKPAGPASLSSTSGSLQTTKPQSGTPTNSHLTLDTKFHYRFSNLPRTYWTLIWTYSFICTGFLDTGVQGNDEADRLAKHTAEYHQPAQDSYLSLTKLKTQIRQSALLAWHKYWTKLQPPRQGRHYRSIHFHLPTLHPPLHFFMLNRLQLATVTQLRLGHGYFNSYLSRLDENVSGSCSCEKRTPAPETPEHILLYCTKFHHHRHILKPVAQQFHLPDVVGSKAGLLAVGEFVRKSSAGTR